MLKGAFIFAVGAVSGFCMGAAVGLIMGYHMSESIDSMAVVGTPAERA